MHAARLAARVVPGAGLVRDVRGEDRISTIVCGGVTWYVYHNMDPLDLVKLPSVRKLCELHDIDLSSTKGRKGQLVCHMVHTALAIFNLRIEKAPILAGRVVLPMESCYVIAYLSFFPPGRARCAP